MYNVYVIGKDETIESIAKKFNTTVDALYQINSLYPDFPLKEGMKIVVPSTPLSLFDYYTIKQGDSLYKIATLYNTNAPILANINGLKTNDYIYPNQSIMVPKPGVKIYITKEGDSLTSVADTLKIPVTTLIGQNSKIYLLPEQLMAYREK